MEAHDHQFIHPDEELFPSSSLFPIGAASMGLPGYVVNIVDVPTTQFTALQTGVVCVVGYANTPGFSDQIYSIGQFEDTFGPRTDDVFHLYDGVDTFFHEGGSHIVVAAAAPDADLATVEALFGSLDAYAPCQLASFGNTGNALQTALMQFALSNDMVTILDAPNSSGVSTLTDHAAALTGHDGDRFSALFAPWDVAPGIASGTTRVVAPSARVCGNIARNDANGMSANDPAAGNDGVARWIQDLSQTPWSDEDRATLNQAGVNISRVIRQQVKTFGWRSLADQGTDSNWSMFSNSRMVAVIKARLGLTAENFEFKKIDGRGHVIGRFKAALAAVLDGFWENDDLYGVTARDAYQIDTGPAVNTIDSIAAGEIHARISLKGSPFAERLVIDVAKIPVTETIPTA